MPVTQSDFDRAWQSLPPDAASEELRFLLEQQLDTPSFAVPIAGSEPGSRAFAQALFFPSALWDRLGEALTDLMRVGRIRLYISAEGCYVYHTRGFGFVLVVRSDDPALASASDQLPADACLAGAPYSGKR